MYNTLISKKMNTKIKFLSMLFMAITVILFSSCNDDDDEIAKPTITMEELGHENSLQAEQGGDLHIEAEVVAEGKINTINVEIHQEGGANLIADTTYTEFAGLKNCTFHKHLEIPETAVIGTYHFHFTVVDLEGNSTGYECENLQIIANDGIDDEEE